MATISMTRKEAQSKVETYTDNPKAFIDALKILGLLHIREETETLYEKHFDDTYGTITLLKRDDRVELWIGGRWQYNLEIKDV